MPAIMRMILFWTFVLLAVACFSFFQNVSQKKAVAPEGAVDLEFPFKDGEYYVLQNGPDRAFNVHTSPNEKYALDIAKTQSFWSMFRFKPSLESDPTFGTAVYSPCSGTVRDAGSDSPDMPIGIRDPSRPGNFVTIDCGGFMVRMVHFKQNSIAAGPGDAVKSGERIGLAGNSGNTDLPHLHIVAYRENERGGDTPLPITMSGRYLSKGDYWPK